MSEEMKRIRASLMIVTMLCIGCMLFGSMDAESMLQTHHRPSDERSLRSISIPIKITSYSIVETLEGEKIIAEGFGRLSQPGEPYLPYRIFSIAIPPNARFIKMDYDLGQKITLQGTYSITPIQPSELEITDNQSKKEQERSYASNIESIYESNWSYPYQIITLKGLSNYREYTLVDIAISPFVYTPQLGIIEYYPDISLLIQYDEKNEEYHFPITRTIPHTDKIAKNIILNYDQSQEWYQSSKPLSIEVYDFVVITLDSLTEAINALVQWETEKGRSVKVMTLSWIQENYQGYDTAEKIRNFLREKYIDSAWGIRDVCIIGHPEDIPMRKTSQRIGQGFEPAETDFYYAELSLPDNESWDLDQDRKYGENNDPIDFYGEITVGRIPWSDEDTVRHICEKSVSYEKNTDPSFKNNMLLLANFPDEDTDGATFMEYCVNKDMHPWMSSWMKTRMYDRKSEYPYDYVLNHQNVVNVWSQGTFGVVSWHSHGNPYGSGGFISVDDCQHLNDEYPSIISAASCSNSDTDHLNIGQAMMKQGAVGFLGANKAAYYQTQWNDVNDGSDQSFKYFFLSGITSGEYTQGQAHQYAISEMYQRGLWDALKYETFCHGSLWGNPDLGIASAFENDAPLKPETPRGPTSGRINVELTFSTVSLDPDGDDLYYCWSWGDGTTDWFGPFESNQEINTSHRWTKKGSFDVKVKAKDMYGTESDWSDPLPISMPNIHRGVSWCSWLKNLVQFFSPHDRSYPLF